MYFISRELRAQSFLKYERVISAHKSTQTEIVQTKVTLISDTFIKVKIYTGEKSLCASERKSNLRRP